jgi:hypothetical protein
MKLNGGGIIHTPTKPPKLSSMTYDQSEHLFYQVSEFKDLIKGSMRIVDLINLEETMGNMDNNMDKIMEMIFNIIQNLEENLPNGDDMAQGTQEDKDSVQIEKPTINKHAPILFYSNNGIN